MVIIVVLQNAPGLTKQGASYNLCSAAADLAVQECFLQLCYTSASVVVLY